MANADSLRALFTIALVFGTAASAVIVSNHPTAVPTTIPPGTLPAYFGDRISPYSIADIEPPTGCLPVNYPTSEAALLLATGEVPEYQYWGYYGDGRALPPGAENMAGQAGTPAPAAPDHSSTNNQVAGVDEADTVKTDGWFIYTATGGRVVTTRAYPVASMAVVSTIELGGYAYGIFVLGDRLVVILQPAYPTPTVYGGDIAMGAFAPTYYNPEVEVRVYGIEDRAWPELLYNYSMTGSYQGARMIGEYLYVVSDYTIYRVGDDLRLPIVSRNGVLGELSPTDIAVPAGMHNTTYLTSIISLNVSAPSAMKTFTFLTKGGGQLFVSARNLYVLGAHWEYTADWQLLRTETIVSKLSFYKGEVKCYFTATVPGTVLNQFSADEAQVAGHPTLRLATTTRAGDWANSSAGVYVLDEKLNLVGSVEGIAPGETVQTSRFVGDRAYLVTFKRVDPLFVISLADSAHPTVIGELTLPGFSQYLQAIDATHLIGIGVDGTETGRALGLKLSLFDVSDPAAPFEVDGVTFGTYAYSQAQYDHHAVLWMPERGLLVIPLQTYDYTASIAGSSNSWEGVVVFAVDPASGFTEKARISHPQVTQSYDYYYGGGVPYTYSFTPAIQRSLWIGEYLYTVSDYTIQANTLSDFTLAGTVNIGGAAKWFYNYGYAGGSGGGVATASPPPTK